VNVPIPMKEKMLKRPKKDSVLVKHKKWLSDLQKTKERLEEQYLDDLQKKEDSKQKVMLIPCFLSMIEQLSTLFLSTNSFKSMKNICESFHGLF
jgi:hypothetical protein